MRRIAVSLLAAALALAPRATRAVPSQPSPLRPVFGPSLHLLDPTRYPASDPHYPRQPLPDGEPSISIAPDGTVWVAALHLRYGTALWRGRFGLTRPAFAGQPDYGAGGYDVALALGTGTPANLYTASLTSPAAAIGAWRISATACSGGAVAANFGACAYYPHLVWGRHDRPWLAAYGRSTVYLSYETLGEGALAGRMTVQRSDDDGRSWRVLANPVAALAGSGGGWPGNLVVDQRNGSLYELFATGGEGESFNRIVVAISRDGGASWSDVTVYQGAPGEDDANTWPSLAVDAAGTLYATWSDRHHIYLATSRDGGGVWRVAGRVDQPMPGLRANLMPWVAAGASGHMALAWYGADSSDNLAPGARWRVIFAESRDGGQSFSQVAATGVIHRGPVCTKGDACPWIQRQLLEFFQLALDPRSGRAAIAYTRSIDFGDYRACKLAANCPQTYYVEEK